MEAAKLGCFCISKQLKLTLTCVYQKSKNKVALLSIHNFSLVGRILSGRHLSQMAFILLQYLCRQYGTMAFVRTIVERNILCHNDSHAIYIAMRHYCHKCHIGSGINVIVLFVSQCHHNISTICIAVVHYCHNYSGSGINVIVALMLSVPPHHQYNMYSIGALLPQMSYWQWH